MALMLGTRNRPQVEAVELTEEDRAAANAAANAAADERRDKTNKFLMNYFLIVAFGGTMAALGALIGFMNPGFIH